MTRMWTKALVALVLAVPVGAIDDPKSPKEQSAEYDSQTRGATQVRGDTPDWFEVRQGGDEKVSFNRGNPWLNDPIALFPGTYAAEVNVNTRPGVADAAKVEAGKMTVVKR
jgi:hypothetical protein